MFENLSSDKTIVVAFLVAALLLRTITRRQNVGNTVRWAVVGICGVLLTLVFLGSDAAVGNKPGLILVSLLVLLAAGAFVSKSGGVK